MWIWTQHAWQGWQEFIVLGKLPALLAAVVLWMLAGDKREASSVWGKLRRKEEAHENAKKQLLYYGAAMLFFCIFPGTAVILMKYQTAFYDYRFIWSLVPMSILLGLGGTLLFARYWRDGQAGFGYKNFFYNTFLTFFCAAVLFLSGGLGKSEAAPDTAAEREHAAQVLAKVKDWVLAREQESDSGARQDQSICLWAPKEILAYARLENNGFTLLYGRNMWDRALNAYSYDVYSQEVCQLYDWMEHIPAESEVEGAVREAVPGDTYSMAQLREYVGQAFSLGANCVLLPGGYIDALGLSAGSEGTIACAWADVYEVGDYFLLLDKMNG